LIYKLITVATELNIREDLVSIVEHVEWTNIDELVSNLNYNTFLNCSVIRMIKESVVCAAIPVTIIPNVEEMPIPINWIRPEPWFWIYTLIVITSTN
jgi:hypothetical protein